MKALIIYSSIHHGNTEKIAKEINKTIVGKLIKASDFREDSLEDYDLVGFGSGIFYGKHHESIINIAERINVKGKNVFVFSTSGSRKEKYNKILTDILRNNGANLIGELSCKGYDTNGLFKYIGGIAKGHPNENDLIKAREFAENLLKNFY